MSNFADKGGPDKDLPDTDLPDTDLPGEQQLDEYLRGGSDVSRQYRQLRGADVPAELDRLVLRQAQQAVKSQPAKSRRWMRWTGPLALAASAVLVVSIVIESGVHEETYLTVPASAPAEVAAKQEAAEPSAEIEDKAAADNAGDPSVVYIVPGQPAAVADMAIEMPAAPMIADRPAAFQGRAISPVAPPPVAAPAPAAPQFMTPAPDASSRDSAAGRVRREEVEVNARKIAPAPTHSSVSAPVVAREDDADLQEVLVTGMHRQERRQTAGPRNTITPPAANSASNAVQQADESRDYSDPEQWLRDIRELRETNKHQEADREWRRFRYVFPNYAVADDDPARGALR